jgi:hypothetical protein
MQWSLLRFRSIPPAIAMSFLAVMLILPAVFVYPMQKSIFDQPAIHGQVRVLRGRMAAQVAAGNYREAVLSASLITQLTPNDPVAFFDFARYLSVRAKVDAALISLERSVDLGFRNLQQLNESPDLDRLRDDKRFAEILKKAEIPPVAGEDPNDKATEPGLMQNRTATVTEKNTRWSDVHASLLIMFQAPAERSKNSPASGNDSSSKLVRGWYKDRTAAGHNGDLYDNLDRNHSKLPGDKFPQLTHVKYSPAAKAANADWTIQPQHMFNRPTLGNSSTASVGSPFWRSNPRRFMIDDFKTKLLYNQYVHNQLYVYPEHNDYDEPRGDVYPANVPYCIISQGSSGSDQPFLDALALTMAAFRPETKTRLVQIGQLMSTVQMIFRRCNRSVETDDDYLSGKAHRIVYQKSEIDRERMVRMAHDMLPTHIPPMIQLRVIEEDLGVPGRDYFHPGPAEQLFNTPTAVARVYRTSAGQRRMVVDASRTPDANNLPLSFHWVVLQGNPDLVSIRPLNASGSRAEIIFQWHPSFPSQVRPEILSNRIDVGVFAHNGTYFSAPGFVTSFTLANEKRKYDAQGGIMSIDYGDAEVSAKYVDPLIDLPKTWKDEYHYSDDGKLTGWSRYLSGRAPQQFNYDGTLIVETDRLGRAVATRPVMYFSQRSGDKPGKLRQQTGDHVVRYQFQSDSDRFGKPVRDSK